MSGIIKFVTDNWASISGSVALLVIVGERVAAITATPEDDKWFSWIHQALAAVGLKFPEK